LSAGSMCPDSIEFTLSRNSIVFHRSTVVYLSTIDVEFRVYYTCLMLVTAAKVLDRIQLCSRQSRGCSEQKQSHNCNLWEGLNDFHRLCETHGISGFCSHLTVQRWPSPRVALRRSEPTVETGLYLRTDGDIFWDCSLV
jgi:hypothetical protein